MNTEQKRLAECTAAPPGWKKWGPYLSERQWGTVREDYSPHGNAWDFFPHDHARSRAYRWGEDGIAGFSDMLKHYEARAPLKRNVLPDELGAAGLFLASDGAAAITGQVLYVDCGYQIMGM